MLDLFDVLDHGILLASWVDGSLFGRLRLFLEDDLSGFGFLLLNLLVKLLVEALNTV